MRIALVVYPGFQMMSLAALSVFELANVSGATPMYEIEILSELGGTVRGSAGLEIGSHPFEQASFDTVLVGGGVEWPNASPSLKQWLREAAARARRVGGICTGSVVLAQAGLLDGRRVTSHWLVARELQKQFKSIKVDEDRIFIVDGPIWTSAGMSAGIDLALAMVEKDHGEALARSVARKLVLYHRRDGGQSQHSELLEMEAKSDRIQTALSYTRANLAQELTVEVLAEVAALSPRQFSRAFRAETGQSPAKAIERLRVEEARTMIEGTCHSVDIVAQRTGFVDPERMRRAFIRTLGHPPQSLRRSARATRSPQVSNG